MNHTFLIGNRPALFAVSILALFSILTIRLLDVQILHGAEYLRQAESNRFFNIPQPADRGLFLDRYGDPLVWNIAKYERIDHPESLFEKLTPIMRDEALHLLASTASARVVTSDERQYRYPLATAQVLGYVGGVTADDLQKDATLHVDQQIGKAGLEKMAERQLRGQDGQQTFEINALGLKQRLVEQRSPIAGQNLKTTLDPYLSEVARQAMGDHTGAVIMTDAQTGEILALISTPTFDPNLLSQTFADPDQEANRREQVQTLFTDPHNLFFDRAIAGAYPPGSIFKTVTALAGLESGKINPDTQVIDDGKLQLGSYEFGNWYYSQYGRVEGAIGVIKALAHSNDIFFYRTAEWAGPDVIAAMARNFGLGQKTGIEMPGESSGLVPDPAWKLQSRNEKWYLGDTYHYGIGQGDLLMTPLQIAQLTQALANHGTLCPLHLAAGDWLAQSQHQSKACRDVNVKSENLDTVLTGMVGACSPKGTAYPFFPYNATKTADNLPVEQTIDQGGVACKTGTAEFGTSDGRGYKKTHGFFTMLMGLPDLKLSDTKDGATQSGELAATASSSADLNRLAQTTNQDLHFLWQQWRQKISAENFPHRITITVLVESDDQNLYREGSADAAPVAKKIFDWVMQ